MDQDRIGTILLVDDDMSVLDSTSMLLSEHGYNVVTSSSAGRAITMLGKKSIDVVVTDIVMPVTSGIELLRQVHNIDPRMPVILTTAFADMEKVIDALKIGAFDFIIKPYTAQLLYHSVEKALSYSRMMQMEKDYKHLLEEYNQEIETLVVERTMSLMALTLADKIRNPASVIGLTCKRVLEKEHMSDRLRLMLEDIFHEAGKLESIVRDFQSLLQSKKSMFRYENMNDVVKDVIVVSDGMTAKKRQKVIYTPLAYPLRINMQKNLFQIAISHLFKNAIDATPAGGTISASTYKDDNHAVLDICDSGEGVHASELKRMFDPMFSTKERRFGMGLPLVKRIVSEHMGNISVESKKGEGTRFTLRLPLRWTGKSQSV